jgi:hypothetical protein
MIASVHVADIGARSGLAALRKTPKPASTSGLRSATVALAAPLRGSVRPAPELGRVGLVAFWDDDDALDRFLADHPLAATLAAGWHVRLTPLRAWGTWPGLPTDLTTSRAIEDDGPAAVLTLGRLRISQAVRFVRTSAKAEAGVLEAEGLTWATGLGRPPFVATCSLWQTAQAASTYAYDNAKPAHSNAIAADRAKPFHHESAFIRFRPYGSHGSLEGSNPLVETWMSPA